MELWDNIEVGGPEDCWPWVRALSRGYGQIILSGETWQVHRLVYLEQNGALPEVVDHDCHNTDPECPGGQVCLHRRCCNPTHLVASTPRRNLLASPLTLASKQAAKTQCPAGHEYGPENTYMWRGMRHCRECTRRRSREYQARKRLERKR